MSTSDETPSRRLPPGAHGLPPGFIARNQRERMIAAMAEACADRGFAEVTVTDIVKRAGVSNVTFYKQFASKRDCLLGAHEELLERLLEEMDRACAAESEREAKVRAGVRVALELLAADTPTARLLTVEVLAGGPAGMERQATAIEALAVRLQDEGGSGAGLPNAAWARVGAMTLLVGRLVMAGEASGLPELEDELVAMALDSSASDE